MIIIMVVAHKEDWLSDRMYTKVTVEDFDDLDVYFTSSMLWDKYYILYSGKF